MTDKPIDGHVSPFEEVRQVDENANEYWTARSLAKILDYTDFRNLEKTIMKAQTACMNSGQEVENHFVKSNEMVEIGSGAKRSIRDYRLSRYACYLIIQNADPAKEIVALGQTYFAVQTRKQEVFEQATEDERRIMLRDELRKHNIQLADAAYQAGVLTTIDFAVFQNHGYKGLYGDLDAKGIHNHKGLKKSQRILDHMGSTELAANLFRATQTEEKIRRENIQGKEEANQAHFDVGVKVRQTIRELGGTMPEDLPTHEDVKKVERRLQRGQLDLSSGDKDSSNK
ncbi:DNA damage-inducible protein D [Paenibacillus sp. IHBB 10380]|uniref:DNA damage-inducible protein D n=1 Tax=Paenibacillus sp. IHBB 10380 TaxID=1566358 RepID=UPI0005CFCD23|nr:DNA damage-inducible protein D [Paenibacillus sp. IHBB 10380]AJS57810.1 damage-indicible protein DnaD [Paenibacillus sp. IHBB 10380]